MAVKISESELCWEFLLYCDAFRVSVVGKLSVLQEHGFWQQQRDIWAVSVQNFQSSMVFYQSGTG